MNWAAILWLGLIVIFLLAEAVTVTMISLWFAAGALAAMVISLLRGGFWLQVTAFLVISCAMLALLRPLARKFLTPKYSRTNIDSVIGSIGIVTAAIDNVAATGQVKLGAMVWTARSTSGDPIAEGTQVRVDRIEGVKVFVSPATVAARI